MYTHRTINFGTYRIVWHIFAKKCFRDVENLWTEKKETTKT